MRRKIFVHLDILGAASVLPLKTIKENNDTTAGFLFISDYIETVVFLIGELRSRRTLHTLSDNGCYTRYQPVVTEKRGYKSLLFAFSLQENTQTRYYVSNKSFLSFCEHHSLACLPLSCSLLTGVISPSLSVSRWAQIFQASRCFFLVILNNLGCCWLFLFIFLYTWFHY